VTQFNAAIPLNGVILTKIDCDAKGGTAISIKKATGIPVLYLGVGQGYDDLVPFTTDYIVSRLMT
jgi:fused signal recognition particle receptor